MKQREKSVAAVHAYEICFMIEIIEIDFHSKNAHLAIYSSINFMLIFRKTFGDKPTETLLNYLFVKMRLKSFFVFFFFFISLKVSIVIKGFVVFIVSFTLVMYPNFKV